MCIFKNILILDCQQPFKVYNFFLSVYVCVKSCLCALEPFSTIWSPRGADDYARFLSTKSIWSASQLQIELLFEGIITLIFVLL